MKWCSAIQASSNPAASAATTASSAQRSAVPSSWPGYRPASRNTPNRTPAPHSSPSLAPPGTKNKVAPGGPPRGADLFVGLEDDPRENRPALVDERTSLVEFLRCVRL